MAWIDQSLKANKLVFQYSGDPMAALANAEEYKDKNRLYFTSLKVTDIDKETNISLTDKIKVFNGGSDSVEEVPILISQLAYEKGVGAINGYIQFYLADNFENKRAGYGRKLKFTLSSPNSQVAKYKDSSGKAMWGTPFKIQSGEFSLIFNNLPDGTSQEGGKYRCYSANFAITSENLVLAHDETGEQKITTMSI